MKSIHTATGTLTYLSSTPTEKQPRGFRIDPGGRYMVVSGEKSDTLSVYEIDRASGVALFKGSNRVALRGKGYRAGSDCFRLEARRGSSAIEGRFCARPTRLRLAGAP